MILQRPGIPDLFPPFFGDPMDRNLLRTLFLLLTIMVSPGAAFADVTLSGTQIRGKAQMNGELKCKALNLTKGGVITGVSEPGAGYWLEGPRGAVLKFGGKNSGINTSLAAGNWRAYPNLPIGVDTASVTLTIREATGGGGGSPSVTGTWNVAFKGGTIGTTTTLVLRQTGVNVAGTLKAPDGSKGEVKGTFDGSHLELSRDTGLQTIQHYSVEVSGNRFSGSFHNEGKYPDRGTFEGVKAGAEEKDPEDNASAGVGGTWTVHFKGGTADTTTTLSLKQMGTAVTGQLRTPDGSQGEVKGTFNGRELVLSRETGLQTVQHYRVTVTGNRFSGTFNNVGKYKDQGTFTGTRP